MNNQRRGEWHVGAFAVIITAFLISGCTQRQPSEILADALAAYSEGDLRIAVIEFRNYLAVSPDDWDARLMLTEVYLKSRDFQSALIELQDFSQIPAPLQRRAAVLSASAYLATGNIDEAISAIEAIALDLSLPEEFVAYGATRAAAGDASAALGAFDEAIAQSDRTSSDAFVGRAAIELGRGDSVAALKDLEEATQIDPNHFDALMLAATVHVSQGRPTDALESVDRAFVSSDESGSVFGVAQALEYKFQILLGGDNDSQLTETVEQISERYPGTVLESATLSKYHFKQGAFQASLDSARTGLAAAPDSVPLLLLAGRAAAAEGLFEQAINAAERALTLDPRNQQAKSIIAGVSARQGRYVEAEGFLRDIGATDTLPALVVLGAAGLQRGDPESALQYFERAVDLDPTNAELRMQVAGIYMQLGEEEAARAQLSAVLEDQKQIEVLIGAGRIARELAAGSFDRASSLARDLTMSQPESAQSWMLLALVSQNNADDEAEIAALDRAIAIDPGLIDALLLRGKAYQRTGRTSAARNDFDEAIRVAPDQIAPLLARARLEIDEASFSTAEAILNDALAKDANNIRAAMNLIDVYLLTGQTSEARQLFNRFSVEAIDDPSITFAQAKIEVAEGYKEKALQTLKMGFSRHPESVGLGMGLAGLQSELGDLAGAEATLESVPLSRSTGRGTLLSLGNVQMEQGDYPAALQTADRLIGENPDDAGVHVLRGRALLALGESSEAIQEFEFARNIEPSSEVVIRLSQAQRPVEPESAKETLEQWLAEHPEDAASWALLAEQLMSEGRTADAISSYERVLETIPDNVIALNNLAWLFLETDTSRALDYAERAYQSNSESASVEDTLGWILFWAGDTEQAERHLKSAHTSDPDNPEIAYHLAVVELEAGRQDLAVERLDAVLKAHAEFPSRSEALALRRSIRD